MPARRFVISRTARADLRTIWIRLAVQASPATADRKLAEIHDAIVRLTEFPGMGHERREVDDARYRFWLVEPYVIGYSFTARLLRVKRVLHGARDFRRHFP